MEFYEDGKQAVEHGGVRELASLSLNIQSKKFYLDVKENLSGRFVKIAEINVSGIKNKVIFDMTSTKILLDHLVDFADFYVALGPQPLSLTGASSSGAVGGSGVALTGGGVGVVGSRPLRSESFKRLAFNRIYHLDLAQNDKGVFLKLSCANQSGGRQGKQTVVFPAQGIVELRDKLKLLVDEFYVQEVEQTLPQSKKFAYDSRLLFMDVGHSNKGFYLKLSEISKNPAANYKRQTIQIPRKLWLTVRDALDELYSETATSASGAASSSHLDSPSAAPVVSLLEEMQAADAGASASGAVASPSSSTPVTPSRTTEAQNKKEREMESKKEEEEEEKVVTST